MAPSLTLYFATISPPSRAVLMTIRNLNLDVEIKTLNILAGEHRRGELVKINPQCCVPTLVDNEFVLWESKAILIYLSERCPRSHALYPKCPKIRALIHQRLFNDSSEFYVRVLEISNLAFSGQPAIITNQHKENLKTAMGTLEKFLEGHDYFVGNQLTLADMAFMGSLSTLINFGYDIKPFKNVAAWYEKMKELPGFDECESGAKEIGAIIKGKLQNSFDD